MSIINNDSDERWLKMKLPGSEDIAMCYEVSSLGGVRRIMDSKIERRRATDNGLGYLQLTLSNNGKTRTAKIHRLVALAFIPNPENKVGVNHKNGIKTDNRLSNLEWATTKENVIHSFRKLGKRAPIGEQQGRSKLTSESVLKIRMLYEQGTMTQVALGEQFGVTNAAISLITARKNWRHLP